MMNQFYFYGIQAVECKILECGPFWKKNAVASYSQKNIFCAILLHREDEG